DGPESEAESEADDDAEGDDDAAPAAQSTTARDAKRGKGKKKKGKGRKGGATAEPSPSTPETAPPATEPVVPARDAKPTSTEAPAAHPYGARSPDTSGFGRSAKLSIPPGAASDDYW
ncbi:hypothetical protein L6V77_12875, partial [Myxococcota bacterium]|nr:hypothetical protein [Myxococcota bacterium]